MSKKFDPKAAAQRFISAANSVGPEEADSSVVEDSDYDILLRRRAREDRGADWARKKGER